MKFILTFTCMVLVVGVGCWTGKTKDTVPVTDVEATVPRSERTSSATSINGIAHQRYNPFADVTNWVVSLLTVVNVWQLREMYRINREVGETNIALSRISSNTDSEKATRARVNSLILAKLGYDKVQIDKAVREEGA